jgi:hypothetical protein
MIALRDEIPSWATRPDSIVGTPILMGLSCAREMCEIHPVAAKTAPAALMNPRRLFSVFWNQTYLLLAIIT